MEEKKQITREIAEKDFDAILKVARVKWERYSATQGRDAELDREDIINAIMDGEISVDENGWPTVYPYTDIDECKSMKFKRAIIGRDLAAMDRVKADHDMAKTFAAMGQYFGVSPSLIAGLERGDMALIQMLWMIFLRR